MRVNGLLHYGLQVPSLETGQNFYSSFGLDTAERDNSLVVRCSGRDLDQTVLTEGPEKRLHHVAFSVDAGSLPNWQRHLETLDIRIVDPPRQVSGGLWFRDPDANLVNLREEALAPWRPFDTLPANFGDEIRRVDQALWPTLNEKTQPRRLGHVLIFSSDNTRSEEFYRRSLGLRLSDRIPGIATFMNTGSGDHHVFGFIQSTHPGLHHSSWEVANLDQIAVGARSMAEAGHTTGWGLGRHSVGSNLFHYIRDPWGSWIEYFSDIDQITEKWEPQDWDTSPAVWCPVMPGEFIVNQESKPE
ncbi:VOC family protein [Streptomyces cellulosae]|uniref:VOC family protein n=1 Tax=Streptomyces cellulosae TaxID=1968 RepID=UPI0004CAF976|nr:VOC family protein [Streptomyces cellulosae]